MQIFYAELELAVLCAKCAHVYRSYGCVPFKVYIYNKSLVFFFVSRWCRRCCRSVGVLSLVVLCCCEPLAGGRCHALGLIHSACVTCPPTIREESCQSRIGGRTTK